MINITVKLDGNDDLPIKHGDFSWFIQTIELDTIEARHNISQDFCCFSGVNYYQNLWVSMQMEVHTNEDYACEMLEQSANWMKLPWTPHALHLKNPHFPVFSWRSMANKNLPGFQQKASQRVPVSMPARPWENPWNMGNFHVHSTGISMEFSWLKLPSAVKMISKIPDDFLMVRSFW